MPKSKLSREQLKSYLRRPASKHKVYSVPHKYLSSFIVYYCSLHGFNPDSTTVQKKCLPLNCKHLTPQRRRELTVKTLREAIDIKNRLGDLVWIEQVEGGYRVIKRCN